MKKTVLAAAAAAVLLLSACSADETDQTPASANADVQPASTSLDEVTVEGAPDEKPTVSFEAPLVIEDTASAVVSEGDGETVEEGQQVTAHMTLVSGTTGDEVYSTYDMEKPSGFPTDSKQFDGRVVDAVVGKNVGSRVLFSINGPASAGQPEETLLYVIDLLDVGEIPPSYDRAEGEEKKLPSGFPEVTRDDTGAPSISQPEGDAPTELETGVAIEGDGPEVTEGQKVTVHYTGWLWDDVSEPFDSSWASGEPYPVEGVGQAPVIEGWNEALIGQKIGSQIVVIIPPDKGYGDAGAPPSIPGGATLVFVIDILTAAG